MDCYPWGLRNIQALGFEELLFKYTCFQVEHFAGMIQLY